MGKIIIYIAIILTGISCTTYRPYSGRQGVFTQGAITTQNFYDELSPYGHWVHNRQYGYVWIPNVGRNFFPYATHGRWVISDYGWTWVSDFDWGWAPFHYGRWDYDPNYGWFWYPGNEWAPAWVEWRYGDGYYGWAPLGPYNTASIDDRDYYRWIFVRERDFGRPNIYRYYVNQRRNNEIIRQTRILRSTGDGGSRITYNPGPEPSQVERATGNRLRRVQVMDSDRPGRRLTNNTLELYRPRVETRVSGNRPAPAVISDVKDIRPMRERNRNYQPGNQVELDEMRESPTQGQGSKSTDSEERIRREREVQRQYRDKQIEMERRQQENDEQQSQREIGTNRRNEPDKEYRQVRNERVQRTDQQRRVMEKEREAADTSRTRRVEREVVRNRRK